MISTDEAIERVRALASRGRRALLLVDQGPWAEVRVLLDEAWYVVQDEETRLRLLIARHIEFGKDPDHAREWVMRSDQRNAELVAATQSRADVLVRIASAVADRGGG